jgi:hypothetical protein
MYLDRRGGNLMVKITIALTVLSFALAVGCTTQQSAKEETGMAAEAAKTMELKGSIQLGMHCTGFDFTYCCVLPHYNSVQSQVIKTSTGKRKYPELLEADPKEADVVVDGHKRFKLACGHIDNTDSEGDKLHYWDVPYDINKDGKYGDKESVANAYFTHLYVYKDLGGSNPDYTSAEAKRTFVDIQIPVPRDNGPAGSAVPSPLKGGHLYWSPDP